MTSTDSSKLNLGRDHTGSLNLNLYDNPLLMFWFSLLGLNFMGTTRMSSSSELSQEGHRTQKIIVTQ